MTPKERSLLGALSICHALIHTYMLVFPTIYRSLESTLKISFVSVGLLGMALYMAFGFGAFPAGYFVDRFGARKVLVACLAGTTTATLFAFIARSTFSLLFALLLLGFSASLYHPAGLAVISFSFSKVGRALGIHGTAGTLGVAIAPAIAGLVTSRLGWHYAYLFLGIIGIGVLIWLLGLRLDYSHHAEPRDEKAPSKSTYSVWHGLIIVYIVGAIYGLIYRGILTFFPVYLSERVSFISEHVGKLGIVSSMIMGIAVVGPFLGGYLASTRKAVERNLFFVFGSLAILSLGFYFLKELPLIIALVPAVLLIFSFQPLQNALIASISLPRHRGRAYGINFTLSFGVGAVASGLGGLVKEKFGLSSVFLLMLGLCIAELIVMAIGKATSRGGVRDGLSQL